jgi:uncharacterized membrane protein
MNGQTIRQIALKVLVYTLVFVVLALLVNPNLRFRADRYKFSDAAPVKLQGNDAISFELHLIPERSHVGLALLFGTYGRINRSRYRLEIAGQDGVWLYAREIDAALLQDNQFEDIRVPAGAFGQDETVLCRLTALDVPADQAIALYLGRPDDPTVAAAQINGTAAGGYPILKMLLRHSLSYFLLIGLLYLGGLFVLLVARKHLVWAVAAIILIFGGLLCLINPVANVPDEYAHSSRAYYVAEFNFGFPFRDDHPFLTVEERRLFGQRGLNLGQAIRQYGAVEGDSLFRGFSGLSYTSAYSALTYLPAALGVFLAKLLRLPMWAVYYSGRVFSLLAYCSLVCLATGRSPHYKLSLAVIALSPLGLFLAASYSQDGMILGLTLLAMAYFYHFSQAGAKPHRPWKIWLLAGLLMLPALSKLPYIVLTGVILAVPVRHFADAKKARTVKLAAFAVSVLALLLWTYAVLFLFPASGAPKRVPQADRTLQIAQMLAAPLDYLLLLVRSLLTKLDLFIAWYTALGWMDIALPYITFLAPLVLAVTLLRDPRPARLERPRRVGLLLIALSGVALIGTAMYVVWTYVGADSIGGVQTRYFLPLLPLIVPLANVWPAARDEPAGSPGPAKRAGRLRAGQDTPHPFESKVLVVNTLMLIYALLVIAHKYYN